MRLFYLSDLDESAKSFFLPEDESKHIVRVLRMQIGDKLGLINGKGLLIETQISAANPKKCEVIPVDIQHFPKETYEVHIAVAPTKNADRIEWLVEKMTEIGLTKISFIQCDNSERKNFKLDRIQKIVIAAAKQSKRYHFPEIEELDKFENFVRKYPKGGIAHCYEGQKNEIDCSFPSDNFPLIIGPEGDFSKKELDLALQSGYIPITLGNNRLRTETAALYACVLMKSQLEKQTT